MLKERIRDLCKSRTINIPKLEAELGLGSGSISKWSKSSPKAETLEKIADYFGVSVDYLLGREKQMTDEEFRAVFDAKYPFDPQLFGKKGPLPPGTAYTKRAVEIFEQMSDEDKKKALEQLEMVLAYSKAKVE